MHSIAYTLKNNMGVYYDCMRLSFFLNDKMITNSYLTQIVNNLRDYRARKPIHKGECS